MTHNSREYAFKTIKELIESGMSELRSKPTEASARIWMDYSQKIVELSTADYDKSILLNYLRVLISIQRNNNMTAYEKINMCLEYLLEVLQSISAQH